ncbi:MAG: hypothetical protein Q9216_005597 [Gyalolechia sp. 2 TL-2023]
MILFHQLGFASLFVSSYLVRSTVAERIGIGIRSQSSSKGSVHEKASCIALGTCPLSKRDDDEDNRAAKCSPDQCPKFCKPGQRNSTGGSLGRRGFALQKRFFEPSAPDQLVNEVLSEPYTSNLSPDPNRFEWHLFDDKEYAAAIEGLSGCTVVFALSSKGVFSSHLWEEDKNTNEDMQPANYETTVRTLRDKLSTHKDDLSGGEAFIMLPTQPNNSNRDLYKAEIVSALVDAVKDASGHDPNIHKYVPLDWKKSPTLGTNERGTAAVLYDPKYKHKKKSKPKKAYRVYLQSKEPVSEKKF